MKTSTTALPKPPKKPASGVRLLRTGRRADDMAALNNLRSALGMRGAAVDAWLAPPPKGFFTRSTNATREWTMPPGAVLVGRYAGRVDTDAFVEDMAAARAELVACHAPL